MPVFTVFGIGISILIEKSACIRDIPGITIILETVGYIRRYPEHSGTHCLHDKFQCIPCSREL